MTSTCPQVRPRLVAFVKAELPPLEVTLVETHLGRCPACSGVVDVLQQGFAMAALDGAARDVAADHPDRLVALVAGPRGPGFPAPAPLGPASAGFAGRLLQRPALWAGAAAAAVAVVAVVAGLNASVNAGLGAGAGPPRADGIARAALPTDPGVGDVDDDDLERSAPTPHLRLVARRGWRGDVARGDASTTEVRLTQGAVAFAFAGGQGRQLNVVTPAGVVEVVGTRFAVVVDGEAVAVSVQEGSVRLRDSAGGGRRIEAGQRVVIAGTATSTTSTSVTETALSARDAQLLGDAFFDAAIVDSAGVVASTAATEKAAEQEMGKPEKSATPRPSPRRSLTFVVDEIDRAEQALRAGRRAEGLAIFAALRRDPTWARQRDVVDFEEARLRGLVLGDIDDARVRLHRLADGVGDVADEARLALCELDIDRQPCVARACLRRVEESGGPQAQSARRLLQRSQVAERCERDR